LAAIIFIVYKTSTMSLLSILGRTVNPQVTRAAQSTTSRFGRHFVTQVRNTVAKVSKEKEVTVVLTGSTAGAVGISSYGVKNIFDHAQKPGANTIHPIPVG